MRISDYIPYGHEQAISREELARRSGVSDRKIRDLIKADQDEGIPVINTRNGGYFLYKDKDDLPEFKAYYLRERARSFTCLKKQKNVRQMLLRAGLSPEELKIQDELEKNQITLFDMGLSNE